MSLSQAQDKKIPTKQARFTRPILASGEYTEKQTTVLIRPNWSIKKRPGVFVFNFAFLQHLKMEV